MITLLYGGTAIWGIKYNLISDEKRDEDGPTERMQHYTLLFQTFCLMNMFNMFNCRVLSHSKDKQFNIFKRVCDNWMFLIVFFFELNAQYAIVNYKLTRTIFGCTPLTKSMHITSSCLGLGTMVVAALVKFIPYTCCEKLPAIPEGKVNKGEKENLM